MKIKSDPPCSHKGNGPMRKFSLDGKPLDGGSKIPKCDKDAFQKAVKDVEKYMKLPKPPPVITFPVLSILLMPYSLLFSEPGVA